MEKTFSLRHPFSRCLFMEKELAKCDKGELVNGTDRRRRCRWRTVTLQSSSKEDDSEQIKMAGKSPEDEKIVLNTKGEGTTDGIMTMYDDNIRKC